MTYARKVDTTQGAIVEIFRQMGCSIRSLHTVGEGVPDLLVGCCGKNLLVECKSPPKISHRKKLTDDQLTFKEAWRGSILYITDPKDVPAIVNALRRP